MASRYWVGGTATWDGTAGTKWAATSGGAGGQSAPVGTDDVFFDANSGANTVTIDSGPRYAASINCTGFTGTLTGNTTLVIGNLTLAAGMTFTVTGSIEFPTTATIISAGKTLPALTLNAGAGTVTLGSALTSGIITQLSGTFTTANYTLTTQRIDANQLGGPTINLGSSTVNLTDGLDFTDTTVTLNAGTSQLNITPTSNAYLLGLGSYTFYNVTVTFGVAAGSFSSEGTNTFNNLTVTNGGIVSRSIIFSNNQTITGTFTCSGASAIQRNYISSPFVKAPITITTATLVANDCDFSDITIAGGAVGTAPTRAGNAGGNTGITFPVAKIVYRVGTNTTWAGSSSWATSSGGAGSNNNYPLPQDTAIIDNNTTLTGTLTIGMDYRTSSIDFSTRTTGITLDCSTANYFYGSLIFGSGLTLSGTSTQHFYSVGTATLTTAGITFGCALEINCYGTFKLGSALSCNSISFNGNNFDAVSYNLTTQSFIGSSLATRSISMGSGLWTLTGTGTIWYLSPTNLTLNANTANILLSDTSTTARTFNGGAPTFNKLTIGGATGTSTLTIDGNFLELASTKTVAHTISVNGSMTVYTWSISGTSGNVVTLNSSASSAAALIKSGNGILSGVDYLDIRNINGSPTDSLYVGSNSTYNATGPNYNQNVFFTQRTNNKIIVLTSTASTTWTVPADWNSSNNTIHIIGGGGGGAGGRVSGNNRAGGGGGGGGGYTKLTNQTLTIGSSITYQCGTGGPNGAANANGTGGGTTSWNAGASTAGGGGGGQATTTPTSTGGTAGTGTTSNGGTGGAGSTSTLAGTGNGGGGGGGAAGPNGTGGNGGNGFAATTAANIAGGGGGGNGGGTNGGNASSATGGTGGNNSSGVGGGGSNASATRGGGGGGSVSAATVGGYGIDVFGVGSGGGAGGTDDATRANAAGLYGGGGAGGGVTTGGTAIAGTSGAQGAIIIIYTPVNNFLVSF